MQTFLPYPDILKSVQSLDNKRLGKQRVEAYQILSVINNRPKKDGSSYKGWVSHPCVVMWRKNPDLLKIYYNTTITEWVSRGYKNTMEPEEVDIDNLTYPFWWGNTMLHDSHKSNLLRKDFNFYSQYNWKVSDKNPYIWVDINGKLYKQESGSKEKIYVK